MHGRKKLIGAIVILLFLTGCSKTNEKAESAVKIEGEIRNIDIITNEKVPDDAVSIEKEEIKQWKEGEKNYINYSAILKNHHENNILIRSLKLKFNSEKDEEMKELGIVLITPDILKEGENGYISETVEVTEDQYNQIKKGKIEFDMSFTKLNPIQLKVEKEDVVESESGYVEAIKGVVLNNKKKVAKDIRIVGAVYTKEGEKEVFFGTMYQLYSSSLAKEQKGHFELRYPELPPLKAKDIEKIEVFAYEWIGK